MTTSGSKNRYEIGKNIYVDFRTTELFLPDYQDKHFDVAGEFDWSDEKQ